MGKYMIRSHVSADKRNEVYKRYASTEASEAPPGVVELGTWSSITGDGAFHLVEAEDPKAIADWLMQWTDLCTYEIETVITREESLELFAQHGLT